MGIINAREAKQRANLAKAWDVMTQTEKDHFNVIMSRINNLSTNKKFELELNLELSQNVFDALYALDFSVKWYPQVRQTLIRW